MLALCSEASTGFLTALVLSAYVIYIIPSCYTANLILCVSQNSTTCPHPPPCSLFSLRLRKCFFYMHVCFVCMYLYAFCVYLYTWCSQRSHTHTHTATRNKYCLLYRVVLARHFSHHKPEADAKLLGFSTTVINLIVAFQAHKTHHASSNCRSLAPDQLSLNLRTPPSGLSVPFLFPEDLPAASLCLFSPLCDSWLSSFFFLPKIQQLTLSSANFTCAQMSTGHGNEGTPRFRR